MKKVSCNRNMLWSQVIMKTLADLGVRALVIAPGSRSTPLVFAAVEEERLELFVHFDERSCGFFALGLAKATKTAVAVVCTSGTAVAELYPAIVEAYQASVPLIIITADRPPHERGKGVNQTINQPNLFANHIRASFDLPLPEVTINAFTELASSLTRAYQKATTEHIGPVHINLPFDKPLEPDNHTDHIPNDLYKTIRSIKHFAYQELSFEATVPPKMRDLLNIISEEGLRVLMICGANDFSKDTLKKLVNLATHADWPLYADAASGLRTMFDLPCIITNPLVLNPDDFDLVLSFGTAPTLSHTLSFLDNTKALRVQIDPKGNLTPLSDNHVVLQMKETTFIRLVKEKIQSKLKNKWFADLKKKEDRLNVYREKAMANLVFEFEGNVVNEIIKNIPPKTPLFISNSLPIRDIDLFVGTMAKDLPTFTNRGASGIDGIVSTAFGMSAANTKQPAVLITGDTAFVYDITSVVIGLKYFLPLLIIVINNNGGAIFNTLPIADYDPAMLKTYFRNPINIDLHNIVSAFQINCFSPTNPKELSKHIDDFFKAPIITVINIKTNGFASSLMRKKYIKDALQLLSEL